MRNRRRPNGLRCGCCASFVLPSVAGQGACRSHTSNIHNSKGFLRLLAQPRNDGGFGTAASSETSAARSNNYRRLRHFGTRCVLRHHHMEITPHNTLHACRRAPLGRTKRPQNSLRRRNDGCNEARRNCAAASPILATKTHYQLSFFITRNIKCMYICSRNLKQIYLYHN